MCGCRNAMCLPTSVLGAGLVAVRQSPVPQSPASAICRSSGIWMVGGLLGKACLPLKTFSIQTAAASAQPGSNCSYLPVPQICPSESTSTTTPASRLFTTPSLSSVRAAWASRRLWFTVGSGSGATLVRLAVTACSCAFRSIGVIAFCWAVDSFPHACLILLAITGSMLIFIGASLTWTLDSGYYNAGMIWIGHRILRRRCVVLDLSFTYRLLYDLLGGPLGAESACVAGVELPEEEALAVPPAELAGVVPSNGFFSSFPLLGLNRTSKISASFCVA